MHGAHVRREPQQEGAVPPPYLGHDQARDTHNGNDPVFKDDMLAHVVQDGDGYLAVIVVATDPDLRQV